MLGVINVVNGGGAKSVTGGCYHRRMGTLWLGGGAEGLIVQNFTQITGADTGFPEGGGDFTSTPTLGIVRVTSSALRKIEKHPPPTIAAAQKKDRRCPKN